MKGQKSGSLGTKMQKSSFAHIFVKSGSIYIKRIGYQNVGLFF